MRRPRLGDAARVTLLPAVAVLALAAVAGVRAPLVGMALALALAGWWWGSVRLHALDRSVLVAHMNTAAPALVETEEPARPGPFETRVQALVLRWGSLRPHERVLLELKPGRLPPQGTRLAVLGTLREPRGPSHGFDERTWLRRRGVHVVLRADSWRIVGRRGGLGGVADRLHGWLERDAAGDSRASGAQCSTASCSARRRGSTTACSPASAPPASTTSSPSTG